MRIGQGCIVMGCREWQNIEVNILYYYVKFTNLSCIKLLNFVLMYNFFLYFNFFRNYRGSHAGAVNCVRFNEDSSVAISGSLDASVKCWDLRSKR